MDTKEELIAPRVDRRQSHRQRVLKGALVVLGSERAYDCTVRNLSDDGAKVTLERPFDIPETFELLIPSEHRIAPAKRIWRTSHDIGVALTGPWRHYSGQG